MSEEKRLHPVFSDAKTRRKKIREHIIEGIEDAFPLDGKHFRIELEKFHVKPKTFSPSQQKKALLEQQTLVEPLKGTLKLIDKDSGKVVDTSKRTLAHVPYFTERHTFVVGGNEYSVSNQVRIKPGVYTRERGNGELEASFNLGKGRNFRLMMDPERGIIFMQYASSKIPLYPVIRAMGISHNKISRFWGRELAKINRKHSRGKEDRYLKKLYRKALPSYKQKKGASREEIVEHLKEMYKQTRMDGKVNERTLGQKYNRVNAPALLHAARKLVRVYNKEESPDDRDSLAFKTLHTAESFMKERIEKDAAKNLRQKSVRKLNQKKRDPKVGDMLPTAPFTKSIHRFLKTSSLSNTPMQINPMEMLDSSTKVTSLGEGGISSTLAVPDEARDVHHSHLGIMDPVRTPESQKAGIDIRSTMHMARDDDGNMYTPVVDPKSKKSKYVSANELMNSRVAFPGQDLDKRKKENKTIDVIDDKGEVSAVDPDDVDYQIPYTGSMYSPATNLVPMLNNAMGNRNIMGAKFQTQAVPLKERETPLVQAQSWNKGKSVEDEFGEMIAPVSPVDGVVEDIDEDFVYIKPNQQKEASHGIIDRVKIAAKTEVEIDRDEGTVKVPYSRNFPMASKTYVDDKIEVTPGQKVDKGQALGENNFTRGKTLALGTNLNAAYVPYYGKNSNDAVVISERAAKKMTSTHMYTESLSIDQLTVLDREKHRNYFGTKYDRNQYTKLNSKGIAKEGKTVEHGELIVAAMKENKARADSQLLGKLHKSLVKPYRDASITWEHEFPGEITDVAVTDKHVTVSVKTEEPMQIGDKTANRYGAKGVVSEIVPDDQMLKDENGDTIDIALTSAGIITRTNPNQIIETAVAKVAKKTGKSVRVPQYIQDGEKKDRVEWAKNLLEKHGLKDKEKIYDPRSDKEIPDIMVGPQYTFKMFKSSDTNYAGRGVGPGYDANLQPTKGGDEGAKSIGKMEFNALVSHNARNVLNEVSNVKGQRNDEYWRRVQLGLPTKTPRDNFAFNKFKDTLMGAGINVNKDGSKYGLSPLTDRDIDKAASGTVKNPRLVKTQATKDGQKIKSEKGGLFDPSITGGMTGEKYSKIELEEPVVNPIFEEPVRRLLDMTKKELKKEVEEKGAEHIKQKLNSINLDRKLEEMKTQAKTRKGSARNNAVKKVKYIRALKDQNLRPGDAYILSKVPVTPPKVRPIMPNPDGTTLVSDANYLYRDVMLANQTIGETPDEAQDEDFKKKQRKHLQDSVGALFGTNEPVSPQNKGRGVKGHLQQITGTNSPKEGYFQSKLMKKRQDLSGRATIAPDHNLGMDEVGLPEDMAWSMYEPFTVKELIKRGYSAVEARELVKDRKPAAKNILQKETEKRPVMINRAPTLHRYNVISAYPKIVPDKTMRLNPFAEAGMNADYDGDALQVHTPVSDEAVEETKSMTLSNLVFGDRSKDALMVFPAHEAIIGNYMATKESDSNKPTKKYRSKQEAMRDYKDGKIKMNDPIEIENFSN